MSLGSYGSQASETSATRAIVPTRTRPTTRMRERRRRARASSDGRLQPVGLVGRLRPLRPAQLVQLPRSAHDDLGPLAQPRIDEALHDVRDEAHDEHEQGAHEEDALDVRVVMLGDGLQQHAAQARHARRPPR